MELTLIERFERVAREHAQRVAIDSPGRALTFAELDDQATRVAGALVVRGVRAGDRVGLHFEREITAFVALLATWKCGATAVPLLSSHPVDRRRQMVDDADLRLIIGDAASSVSA